MAEVLKIESDSVVGKLLRVWIWADQNSVDGNGVTVSDAFIDRLTGRKGFARAMRVCGWLEGENGCLSFPGFHRHNGSTAKERASTNRRVAKHRKCNGASVTKTVTREEKRREEVKDADASSAAADNYDLQYQARRLCEIHPRRSLSQTALGAAMKSIQRHTFEKVMVGTKAYADAVARWTDAERLQYVKNPESFFADDLWNQPAENWGSRIKARQGAAVVDLEKAKAALGRRAAHIS